MQLRMQVIGILFVMVVSAGALSACARSARNQQPAPPVSAAEHMAEAERHERRANELGENPAEPGEPSPTMAGVEAASTSGGEPLTRPRWTSSVSPETRHGREARRLREHAAEHRRIAKGLLQAEENACRGLTSDEIDLGPFFHGEDIESVDEIEENGRVMGATIRFRDVEDLTVQWMERSVACARARAAALGYPADALHLSPLMLQNIDAQVVGRGQFIEVVIRARDANTGYQVLERARASMRGPEATEAEPAPAAKP